MFRLSISFHKVIAFSFRFPQLSIKYKINISLKKLVTGKSAPTKVSNGKGNEKDYSLSWICIYPCKMKTEKRGILLSLYCFFPVKVQAIPELQRKDYHKKKQKKNRSKGILN